MRRLIGRLLWWFVRPAAQAEAVQAFVPLPSGARLRVRGGR